MTINFRRLAGWIVILFAMGIGIHHFTRERSPAPVVEFVDSLPGQVDAGLPRRSVATSAQTRPDEGIAQQESTVQPVAPIEQARVESRPAFYRSNPPLDNHVRDGERYIEVNLKYHPEDLRFRKSDDGTDHVMHSKMSILNDVDVGAPGLPRQRINVLVPSGARVTRVEITPRDETLVREGVVVAPIQHPASPSHPLPPLVEPDPAIYTLASKYPQEVGAYERATSSPRGYTYAELALHPVRYAPAAEEVYLVREMNVKVFFTTVGGPLTARRIPALWQKQMRSMVVNPQHEALFRAALQGETLEEVRARVAEAALEPVSVDVSDGGLTTKPSLEDRFHFSQAETSVEESAGVVTLEVRKSGTSQEETTVAYTIMPGTAEQGTDYVGFGGTLVFPALSQSQTIDIPILDNDVEDGDRHFEVVLSDAPLMAPYTSTVWIRDTDGSGVLQFASPNFNVIEGSELVEVFVERVGGIASVAEVRYETEDATAVAGTDYTHTAGTLRWEAGEGGLKSFFVPVLLNPESESSTYFFAKLSDATGAVVGASDEATVMIAYSPDHHPKPTLDVDYLIITQDDVRGQDLKIPFNALGQHRAAFSGLTWQLRTVSWIDLNYAGADIQAKIKACVMDYAQRGASFVVLGGDDLIVPTKYIEVRMNNDRVWAPADRWYSTTYGGPQPAPDYGSGGSLAPFIHLGRIPIRTVNEGNAYVNKVKSYDLNPPVAARRKFMLSGNAAWDRYTTGTKPDEFNDGNSDLTNARRDPLPERGHSDEELWERRLYRDFVQNFGWEASQVGCMFDTMTSWDQIHLPGFFVGSYAASPQNCRIRWSEGWMHMVIGSHGAINAWDMEDHNTALVNAPLTNEHVGLMTGLTYFLSTSACFTAGFDGETGHACQASIPRPHRDFVFQFPPNDPANGPWVTLEPDRPGNEFTSLSESFIRNANGGALVYIGSSRESWGSPGSYYGGACNDYQADWLKAIFRENQVVAGQAYTTMKIGLDPLGRNIDFPGNTNAWPSWPVKWWLTNTINLQGDPALRIIGVDDLLVTFESATAGATFNGANPPLTMYVSPGDSAGPVTATPPLGYGFSHWTIPGEPDSNDNPITINNVAANMTITAHFVALPQFILNYGADVGGTISGPTPQTVYQGHNGQAVTAVPQSGYHFVQWSDGVTANPRTDTNVQGNINVTAQFAANEYLVTFHAPNADAPPAPPQKVVTFGGAYGPLPVVTRNDWVFGGWWTQADGLGTLITDISTVTIASNHTLYAFWAPAQGIVAFTNTAMQVNEGAGTLTVSVGRLYSGQGVLRMRAETVDGTATSPQDYTHTSVVLEWANGELGLKTFTIPIIDDLIQEPDETFSIFLTVVQTETPPGAQISTPQATVTIIDNDTPPAVSVQVLKNTVWENWNNPPGTDTPGLFRFTVSRLYGQNLTLSYVLGGLATPGVDYVMEPDPVLIPANAWSVDAELKPIDDEISEGDENAVLTLVPTGHYSVGAPGSGTVTILDNEMPPVITIHRLVDSLREDEGVADVFRIQSSSAITGAPMTITYTVQGTATPGYDYAPLSGVAVIPVGESHLTIPLAPILDNIYEGDETVVVTLQTQRGYVVGTPGTQTVTLLETMPIPFNPGLWTEVPSQGGQGTQNLTELLIPWLDEFSPGFFEFLPPGQSYYLPVDPDRQGQPIEIEIR